MIEHLKKQINRDKLSLKSITALVVFGAIILVFVFFGMPTQNPGGASTGSAARVNNTIISVADFKNEAQRLEQMYASLFGGQMSNDMQRQFVRGQALDNLISVELISQAAEKEGVLSTDAEIRDFIAQEITAFQKDGRFQRDLYYNYLNYSRLTASEFEDRLRKDRKNQRARRVFEAASTPLTIEIEKIKALKESKMNVAFLALDKEKLSEKMAISEEDVVAKLADSNFVKKAEDFFNANKEQFKNAKNQTEELVFDKLKNQVARKMLAADKAEVQINRLDEAVTKGDLNSIDSIAKSLGVSWDETGFFDLNQDAVPKLSSPVLLQSSFELSEEKPLLNRVVRDGGTKYVLKLKAFKKDNIAMTEDMKQSLQRDRSNAMLSKWIQSYQNSAKIEKNTQVLR